MEQDQEEQRRKQHICKVCKRSFLSGKVLGGHMRSHGPKKPAKRSDEKKLIRRKGKMMIDLQEDVGVHIGGYGLRENPKKSWKFSSPDSREKKACNFCGKRFESMNGLFGHMKLHRNKKKELMMNEECDEEPPEFSGPVRRKRSSRIRYKADSSSSSFNDLNETASFTEIDPEVEELAICLLMLSRGRVDSSSSFEVKSWNPNDEGENFACTEVKLSPNSVSDSMDFISENDSGFAADIEYKMPEIEKECQSGTKINLTDVEMIEGCMEEVGSKLFKFNPSKKARHEDFLDVQLKENSYNTDSDLFDEYLWSKSELNGSKALKNEISKKGISNSAFSGIDTGFEVEIEFNDNSMQHKCPICFKVFASGKALGGHKKVHGFKHNVIRAEHLTKVELSGICNVFDLNYPAKPEEEGKDAILAS